MLIPVFINVRFMFFMLISGVNFTVQYRLFAERRVRRFFQDPELHFYILIICVATLAVAATLIGRQHIDMARATRQALFQVVSITTTTGFSNADYELWPSFAQLIFLSLMFCGGCTGSTAGGMKVARVVLLTKVVRREFRRIVQRRGIFTVRLGESPVDENAVRGLLNLVHLALIVNFCACLILTALGLDVLTSISAVAASMFNVGPGLHNVGPYDNYGALPQSAKWVLSFCMLAGRLEFYSLLVLIAPDFWRR
ncbi:MAG: TrkH family potassium uptake protein [Acidobacteria bacterium]|nr:TrkH family potassium uptake protein [Acidobacteriota bacterium]